MADAPSRAGNGRILPLPEYFRDGREPFVDQSRLLAEEGLIGQERLDGLPDFPEERVDVSMILGWKQDLLKAAWRNFTHDP